MLNRSRQAAKGESGWLKLSLYLSVHSEEIHDFCQPSNLNCTLVSLMVSLFNINIINTTNSYKKANVIRKFSINS